VKTCYFYTRIWDDAVAALPADAEFVYVGDSITAYWDSITGRWGTDDLMVVEHDIKIHGEVQAQFEACPNQWCTFPYWSTGTWFTRALGCTRFRKEIMGQVSVQAIQDETTGYCSSCKGEIRGCWLHVDVQISRAMDHRNILPCIHSPHVEHLTQPVPDSETYELYRKWADFNRRFPRDYRDSLFPDINRQVGTYDLPSDRRS
jgi:hypothetical protein